MLRKYFKFKKMVKRLNVLCNECCAENVEKVTPTFEKNESVLTYTPCLRAMRNVNDWTGQIFRMEV